MAKPPTCSTRSISGRLLIVLLPCPAGKATNSSARPAKVRFLRRRSREGDKGARWGCLKLKGRGRASTSTAARHGRSGLGPLHTQWPRPRHGWAPMRCPRRLCALPFPWALPEDLFTCKELLVFEKKMGG
ncbi:hypothetical protein BC826DRAFT_1034926, partial [Russula brevipes]